MRKDLYKPVLHGGVYGIFVDGRPVYIGHTTRPFNERFDEHRHRIAGEEENNLDFYKEITEYDKNHCEYKILFNVEKARYTHKLNGPITRYDLECIEFGFIYLFKPKYNKGGNTEPFIF